ncbi:ABC-type Fe3+ transport system, permease component [Opitutaceae bacterium TAV1]|nr:ABC-type Fe3+ transport system, permease component [Opitutaceae bacterium TAV1]
MPTRSPASPSSSRLRDRLALWPLWLAAGFVLVTVGYPLAILAVQSVFPEALAGKFDGAFSAFAAMAHTPGLGEMLGNSLLWGLATTAGAWLLGLPAGVMLARIRFPGKRLARIVLLLPVMTPPYLLALAWILLMQPGGFWDNAGGVPPWLQRAFFGFWGVTFVMVMGCFGGVALAVEAALLNLGARLEDAAASLGARPARIQAGIIFPLLLPAILNSGVLVFVEAMSNFGVPAILGPRANLPLLPAEIYALVTNWPVNIPLATALSLLLCLAAVALLQATRRLLARHGGIRTRPGSPAQRTPGPAGVAGVWGYFAFLFVISGLLPLGVIVLASLVERWNAGTPVWTLQHYRDLLSFSAEGNGLGALGTSALLGGITATVCVIVGGLAAWAMSRHPGFFARLADQLSLLPRIVPRIVIAVGMILAWNAPWVVLPVYNTIWILLVAYFALYQSDAVRFADTGMRGIGQNLEHAAAILGAPRWRILAGIVLPLLRPALLAAWITTFVVCMRDLVASILLLPPGVQTVGSFIFTQFEQGNMARAMAMATCATLLSSAVLFVLQRRTASRDA